MFSTLRIHTWHTVYPLFNVFIYYWIIEDKGLTFGIRSSRHQNTRFPFYKCFKIMEKVMHKHFPFFFIFPPSCFSFLSNIKTYSKLVLNSISKDWTNIYLRLLTAINIPFSKNINNMFKPYLNLNNKWYGWHGNQVRKFDF